jgi:DNA primase
LAGFIPEDQIIAVRNAASIADVISQYVALKKAGRNLVGLCPFHADKAPSFTVSEEKQIFHCFGCGQGGNVFTFVMLYHNLSFPEAVRFLAQRCGVDITTRDMTPGQRRKLAEKERLFEINLEAAKYFEEMLSQAPQGKPARAYVAKRKMTADVIDRFRLGYAPKGWENLVNHFSRKKVDLEGVEKTGLIIAKKGGYYDRFRDRIIFPILDVHGRVVGFGGRALDDSLPKYLNSPETPIYHKGKILYGLAQAKTSCRQCGHVFVVEGYFDLLALHCHGFQNVVASLGTALTREHIRILRGYAERIVLVFDSDEAGTKAALRALPLFEEEKADVRIMTLPEGKDPDSFVMEAGGEAFADMAQEASGVMEFLMDSAVKEHGLSPEGKVKIVAALKGPLGSWPDSVGRAIYVKALAERLDIDERAILEQVRGSAAKTRKKASPPSGTGVSRLEETVLGVMLQRPDIVTSFNAQEVVESFQTERLKKVGQAIMDRIEAAQSLQSADLVEVMDDPEVRNLISCLAVAERSWDKESCLKIVNQYCSFLRKRQERQLLKRIKEAEKAHDESLLLRLLEEKQRRVHERLDAG